MKTKSIQSLILFLSLATLVPAYSADSLDNLLDETRKTQRESSRINKDRERRFLREKSSQAKVVAKAEAEVAKWEAKVDVFQVEFAKNQEEIVELKKELRESMGDLRQMYAMVRQSAGDFKSDISDSLVSGQLNNRKEFLNELTEPGAVPAINDIREFWFLMQQEMTEAGKVAQFESAIIDRDGSTRNATVTRAGLFTASADGEFLKYLADTEEFQVLAQQPSSRQQAQASAHAGQTTGIHTVVIDPTRGEMLALLSEAPSLVERVKQGGAVGYVIIGIGLVGLLIALLQWVYLMAAGRKMAKQCKNLDQPQKGNPLGRVLWVVKDADYSDLELLEIKLDEAILKESPNLERSLPLLKLCAAVAPLLGLLGTVTGMILTFQAITLFGTGDPKLMAGGISQALVTTVLGLCVAIPLLFVHGFLNSRSKKLLQMLDEQSAGMLARHIEASNPLANPSNMASES